MNREHLLLAASAISVGLLIPLADASIKGALLLALAMVVTFLLRQRSAAVRHLAWVSALGLLLVLPVLSAVLPGWNVLPEAWRLRWLPVVDGTTEVMVTDTANMPLPAEPIAAIAPLNDVPSHDLNNSPRDLTALDPNPAVESPGVSAQVAVERTVPPTSGPAIEAPRTAQANLLGLTLLSLWLIGGMLLGVRLIWSWLTLNRLARTARAITQGPVFDDFQTCCREMGVTHPVTLLQGEATAMPMAWGFVRSHILVPSVCEAWSPAQRRAVLLHELGHVLRRDPLWHGLVQVATAVYWFHPLVWLAAWRIHIERERACDDLVLNRGIGAHDYAGHLLDVVSQGRFRRIGASVGVAMAATNKLEGRVRSILDDRQDRRPLTRLLITAGLLIAVAIGTPLAMMRAADRARDEAAVETTDETNSGEASEEVAEVSDDAVAPDPVVQLQSAHIHFADSMLVAWNERGALGLVFEPPASEGRSTEVIYRWRFHDGTEQETISEGKLPLGQGEQILVFSGMSLVVTGVTAEAATIAYDPSVVCVHPLDRKFFTEYDRQIPSQPELRPAVDLAEFLLPDEGVQQQMRDDDYVGQGTDPGYPRVPLPFKIRYADNGLVVATPEGVALFDFIGPLDRRDGNEQRRGVEYHWRFVSADGTTNETGMGEVWELSRDDNSVYAESLHYIEAGPIHIPWSINVADAGWIYYDPAWHGVWLIAPETATELASGERNVSELQHFAFGPRAAAEAVSFTSDNATQDEPVTNETTIRGFDLTPYRFTDEWTPLYEPGAPLDRDLSVADGGCWRCIVNPGEWRVHYSPVRGDFYVHRTTRYGSGQEVAEADYYGPIEGNPIELLGLEDYLAESINRHHATDAFGNAEAMGELQLLLTSENPTLIAAGLRVLNGLGELEVFEERYLRNMVDEAAATLLPTPEQLWLNEMAFAALDKHLARIEERKIELAASEYAPGSEPNADELAANWGEPVDGLSLAIVPWEQGEPTLRLGERVESWLVVRNVSEEPIRLSTMGGMGGVSTTLVDEETNEELHVLFPFFDGVGYGIVDGLGVPRRFQLEPGQVLHVKNAAFWAGAGDVADLAAQINFVPGHTYRLTMSLQLPESFSYDEEGRITVPARGEFYNRLTSGTVRIRVAEIDGTVPPESGGVEQDPENEEAVSANEADDEAPGDLSVLHEDDDGTMRLTPTNEDEREVVDRILVWGSNDYDGWRVGALLVNDLDSDEPLTAGDTAGVRYFLQNVTDQPKTILVAPMGDAIPVMGSGGQINLNTHAGSGTVEITAQPGEAVSPDGHYVLVDTTGLPDGEYELYSTAAFWMQNADGSGSSSPWRVGGVPMTIGSGGKFDGESMTDDEGIVWGGTVAGLRVGMRFPEGKTQFANGSLLQGDLFVKNTTSQPITFTWDKPAPMDQNQVVYTAEGEWVELNRVFYTGSRAQNPQTFTVEPGEQIALGNATLLSVTEASLPRGEVPSAQLVAATGSFTWQVHVQLNVPAIPQFLFVVGSGPVPFEIVWANGVDDEPNDDPSNRGDAPADDDEEELSILHTSDDGTLRITPSDDEERALLDQILMWTDAVDGWRVGAVLMNSLESDLPLTRGDTATVRYFMQNVTDQSMSIAVAPIDGWSRDLRAGGWMVIETRPGRGPVEFSAAPGEAVSPSGFSVDVDTTGLADGKYELDATTVFWRQDANGQGASSPWRVAGVPVTIGEGGSLATETMTDEEGIHWGEVVSGLRLGLRLVDGKHEWPVGSLIEADLFVKNTTDEPIAFVWDAPPPSEQGQTVYNSDWEIVQLNAAFYTGIRPSNPQTFTVEPGEQVTIGKALLKSAEEASTPGPSDPMQLVASSGKFYWVMNVFVEMQSVPQIGIVLGTGTEEFDIVAADANDGTNDGNQNPDDDEVDTEETASEELEASISWGEPVDGWRAGMRVEEDAAVEAGEQVTVQFYVQNMLENIHALPLIRFDGTAAPFLHAGGVIRCNVSGGSDVPGGRPPTVYVDSDEIVRLEGCTVILDTTGFPDGDYSIEANAGNHAYWIRDSAGGPSDEHIMSPARLRIGRGGQFPDVSSMIEVGPVDQVFWGYDVKGLRIGIQMQDRRLEWPIGSRIEARIVAENLSHAEIEFTTWWGLPPDHDISIFKDPNTPVDLDVRKLTVFQDFNRTFTIPAGEQLELGTLAIDSRVEFENYEAGRPPRLIAEPGTFRWEAAFNVTRPDLPNWTTHLITGRAYFDLVSAE